MTSKDSGSSEHALIDLIYRHLKENGYQKAASALKKHAPQVEATNVTVSLDDIFKKWVSEEQNKKNDKGKAPQTSSESAENADQNTRSKKKVKSQTPATAGNQKRKRTETKTIKSSSAVKGHTTERSSPSSTTGEASDSDSSLDVEKWKLLACQLSDADIAKMDAFTSVSTSTAKAKKTRKPAQPKKTQDQTKRNSKPSGKKTKVKTSTSPTKTGTVKTPLKPAAFNNSDLDKVKTTSNEAVCTEPNIKIPERMSTRFSGRFTSPTTGVSNGLASDRMTVKHKEMESHVGKTRSKKVETKKTDAISESKPTDTPCKKAKSKKGSKVTRSETLETPSRVTDPEVAIQKSQHDLASAELSDSNDSKQSETKAKKEKPEKGALAVAEGVDTAVQTDSKEATAFLISEQLKINQVSDFSAGETFSKKAKSKKSRKSKEAQEHGDVSMAFGECQMEVDNSCSKPHQTETLSTSEKEVESESSEPVEKKSKKAKKSVLEPTGTEKPSKKIETRVSVNILEPISTETPAKKTKTKKALETNQLDSPSKKAALDVAKGEPMDSNFSKSEHTDNLSKKSKRKRADSSGENMAPSVTEESVSAVEEEGNLEPRKKKKKKKDKEKKNESDEDVEKVSPPAEATADILPSGQKKKKKKKQEQEHEHEEMPSMSTPAPKDDFPKKKKKSAKEKKHADT